MKYVIGTKLGKGSFGTVYEAHASDGSRYAVKVVERGDRDRTELLKKQFDYLSTLDHKRIVKVIDFDSHGSRGASMVTEMVDGVDLAAYVKAHGMEDLVLLIAEILDGLRYIHGLGRLHGDIKPGSIMVYRENGRPEIKLIDAGLDIGKGTNLPMLAGTPSYMAPEIIRNLEADERSDLYSLGVTLFEVMTGENPFVGEDEEEVCTKQIEYQPPPPSRINPELDSAWDEFIGKLIEKESMLRYRNTDEAGLALEKASGRPGAYLDNITPPKPNPMVVRHGAIQEATACLIPLTGKGVLIHGEQGCGISQILERISSLAKLEGLQVFAVDLDEQMPAIAQIVEEVLGSEADRFEARTSGTTEIAIDGSARFTGVLDSFRSGLSSDREYVLIVDGGESMGSDETVLLGALAAELKGRIGVVVGREGPQHASVLCDSDGLAGIHVPTLNQEEIERAIGLHFGTDVLPAELTEEIYHRTGGNVDLLEMTLDHLWTTRSVSFVHDKGRLRLNWDGRLETPTSVKALLCQKTGGLSPKAVEALKVILAAGGRIETELLSQWFEPGSITGPLQELLGSGLVHRSEGWIGLVMGIESTEEALVSTFDAGEKERISIRMAGILDRRIKSAYDFHRLGLLYLQGGRHEDAFRCFTDAGERFIRLSARDALIAYRKALECDLEASRSAHVFEKIGDLKLEQGDLESAAASLQEAASLRPSSMRKLGWVKGLRGEYQESTEILKQCERSAYENGDDTEIARIRSDLGYIYALQSERNLCLDALGKAADFFEANKMHLEAGRAYQRIAFMEWKVADFKRSALASVRARKHFDQAGDRKRVAICLMGLGVCYRKEMDFRRSEKSLKEALSILTALRAMGEKASCQQNYALLLLDQGQIDPANRMIEQAISINRLLGNRPYIISCTILQAALSLEIGNWQQAEAKLLDLLDHQPAPDPFEKAMIKRYLALAVSLGGRFEEAKRLVNESYGLAGTAQDAEGRGQALLAGSLIMLRTGDYRGAAEEAGRALEMLRLSSSMVPTNEAHRVIGEALCLMGQYQEGMAALVKAKKGFEVAPRSLHMGRVFRALALVCFAEGDRSSGKSYLRKSMDIFRSSGGRYDYALALVLGGRQAVRSTNLLRARHNLQEAARIFKALKIEDLYREAVNEMEKVPSGEIEVDAVSSLSEISRILNSSHDLTTVINLAMDLAIEYLGAERGVMMLEDEATEELTTFTERSMDSESLEDVIKISRSIVESVRKTKESVIAADATQDTRFKHSRSIRAHNIMSVMCVPLIMEEKLLGIIYLDSRDVSSGFSKLETEFVRAFANQVSLAIANAKLVGKLYDDVADLRVQASEKYSFDNIIGPGKKMQEVFRKVDKAARSNLRILITGENGTGKQVIANLVHRLSERRNKSMIQVNCAAISKDLLESELFGIERRVATGVSARSGYFERADGGTLFLDEIGDMPATTQMNVLRVLSEKEFERVGGSKIIKVDVRVISATNKDLKDLVEKGLFRKDLYYRINHMRIHIPPLRERKEDLPHLIDHFLAEYAHTNSKPDLGISREALALLRQYWWPGNVRELEACIQHAVVKAEGDEILVEDLHDEILENMRARGSSVQLDGDQEPLPTAVNNLQRRMIKNALRESGGVKTRAAKMLGVHESTLRKKMRILGIDATGKSS